MTIKHAIAIALVCGTCQAEAITLRKYDTHVTGPNLDLDYEFTLDRGEVDSLGTDPSKQAIYLFCRQILPPIAAEVAAKFAIDKVNDVKQKAGPTGAWVKMTIRNGHELHVWEVYPTDKTPPNPSPPRTFRGVCDKNGQNCKIQP
jgi:hypothetical protein